MPRSCPCPSARPRGRRGARGRGGWLQPGLGAVPCSPRLQRPEGARARARDRQMTCAYALLIDGPPAADLQPGPVRAFMGSKKWGWWLDRGADRGAHTASRHWTVARFEPRVARARAVVTGLGA